MVPVDSVLVVNHVSDTVSVVNLSQGKVIATLKTDDEPADVCLQGHLKRPLYQLLKQIS